MTSRASSTKARGTGKLGARRRRRRLEPNRSPSRPSTCQTTASGGNAGFGEVARGVAPALEIVGCGKRHTMRLDHRSSRSTQAANSSSCCAFRCDQRAQVGAVGEQRRAPVRGRDERPDLGDRQGQPRDVVEPQPAPAARRDDAVHRLGARARARAAASRAARGSRRPERLSRCLNAQASLGSMSSGSMPSSSVAPCTSCGAKP